jgi:hypothetical protein
MIYVVTHKNISLELPENYKIIGVGNNSIINEDLHDNVGDNISSKNKNYCELTALYWIWKNSNDDIVGLEHYRRMFLNDNISEIGLLNEDEILSILSSHDIIVPTLYNNKIRTVYQHYVEDHKKRDIELVQNIINFKYPEYNNSFNQVMNSKYEYGFNMLITRKDILDEYSQWLFDILFDLESKIDISKYDEYQKRVYGFLSERLFNVWLKYKKYNVKENVIANILDSKEKILDKKLKKIHK